MKTITRICEEMITRINPCNPFTIRVINAERAQRATRGYAIVEYLLVSAAAIGAIMAIVMSGAVAWKTLEVSNNEITKVNGIPWQ